MTDLATDPAEFWERRRSLPVEPTTDADVAERRDDGHLVLSFDLPADGSERFESTLDRLSAFDCLAVAPSRYLHVTVTPVGFLTDDPNGPGEFATDEVDALAADIGAALSGGDPFEVRFPRLNLFPTVVYAEVDDCGRFAALNDRVCALDAVPVHDRDRRFVPHAALAQFRDEAVSDLVDALERDRSLDVGPVTVDSLSLVCVDLGERFPAFDEVRRYDLGG
ncbi:2'-5' RNA ligase family protein [Halomarina salina]|uniref:2'-5' RNA ligase family protein n=1 Tax=Halomarina salina TaxID=1872699 RepID=A0ABD5RHD2_9EURY|nr:2'-5' RNA ligase family protein [Halomarina salina]